MLLVTAKARHRRRRRSRQRGECPHLQVVGRAPGRADGVVLERREPAAAAQHRRSSGARARRPCTGGEDKMHDAAETLSPRYSRRPRRVHRARRRVRRGLPAGQQQVESDLAARRAHRVPDHAGVDGARVRQRRRRRSAAASSASLAIVGTFLVLLVIAVAHRRVDLRPQPHHRAWVSGSRSTTASSSCRASGRSSTPGTPPTTRSSARSRPQGRRSSFSALTVAVALAALLVFPLAFLRSFAYAGIGVALLAAHRRGRRPPGAARRARPAGQLAARCCGGTRKPVGEGVWHRIATFVMRRPVPIATRRRRAAARPRAAVPADPVRPSRRPRAAAQRLKPAGAGRHPRRTSRPTRPARSRSSRSGIGDPAAHVDRDRSATPPRCRSVRGVARVDAAHGQLHQRAARRRAGTGRPRASQRRDGHVAVGRAVGRAATRPRASGSSTPCATRPRPFRRARRRAVGRARRHQGVAVLAAAARRRA